MRGARGRACPGADERHPLWRLALLGRLPVVVVEQGRTIRDVVVQMAREQVVVDLTARGVARQAAQAVEGQLGEAGGPAQRDKVARGRAALPRAAREQTLVQPAVVVRLALVPQAQVGATIVAQAVGGLCRARVPGVDVARVRKLPAVSRRREQRHQPSRRRVVHQVPAVGDATVERGVEVLAVVRMRHQQVAGHQLSGPSKGDPVLLLRVARPPQFLVHLEAVVEMVEDAAHQPPAVEAVVEVVRTRLRAEELEGAQHAGWGHRVFAHCTCIPACRMRVKGMLPCVTPLRGERAIHWLRHGCCGQYASAAYRSHRRLHVPGRHGARREPRHLRGGAGRARRARR